MLKAILFDFNGTLVDDDAVNSASWQEFIEKKLGRRFTDEELQSKVHGVNVQDSLRFFLGGLTNEECSKLEEEKEGLYRQKSEEAKLTLMPGAAEFLDSLLAKNIKINIGTAAGETNVRFFFRHYGLDRWFSPQLVVYNNGKITGKPAPDIYLLAAERLGVDIKDCAVFEDSESGLEAGRRAGAAAVVRMNPTGNTAINAGKVAAEFRDYTDPDIWKILEE